MNDSNLLRALGQVSGDTAGGIFREHIRGAVLQMISSVIAEEVTELCGPKHQPDHSSHFRAGTARGSILHDGEKETVVRPRVRRRKPDGSSEEVVLETYQAARCPDQLRASVIAALAAGVSSREVASTQKENSPGLSRSNVSRHWMSVGHQFVDELRGRDLSEQDWAILMLDGLRLSKDQLAIVAIGITASGHKHVLDFDLGSTENSEVCRELMRRLKKRGFHCDRRLLAVLDGSEALKTVVKEFFPDAVIQRCLVHKERNIKAKLSKRHWSELARLFRRLRKVQGKAAAEEVVRELRAFLSPINAEALKSLEEAGGELIALQSLDVPNTLHRNLLSTNAIENSFMNTRRKIGRVKRFRAETDQATRWLAFALVEVEKGFRRISGHADMPKLVAALKRKNESPPRKTSTRLPVGECKEVGGF